MARIVRTMTSRIIGLVTKVSRAGAARAIFTGARVAPPKVAVPAFKLSVRSFAAAAEVSVAILRHAVTIIFFLTFSTSDLF